MDKFYAELDVNGYIKYVGEVKKSEKGKDYINGIIGWHDVFNGKEMGWSSVPFIAFGEMVDTIALLQKDDEVHLKGKLQTRYDKATKVNSFSFIAYEIVDGKSPKRQPKPQQQAKQEQIVEADEEDDLPF